MSAKFKEPFGLLIRGTFSETMSRFKALVEQEKPPVIVSVGDTVSLNLHLYGLKPNIAVTDNKSLRKSIKPAIFENKKIIHVKNPRGTITDEAFMAIQKAVEQDTQEHTHIIVDGEEDLLTLAAVFCAPNGSFIVYGQPSLGIVVVKTGIEKKIEAGKLLQEISVRKAK